MKIGSDCSGSCFDCRIYYLGGCIAGHGDDGFISVDRDFAERMLEEGVLY